MRNLGICAIVLALAAVAPPGTLRSEFEPLWALGALVLLALTAQSALARLRLPALVGWVGAGLALGPSALGVVDPVRVPLLSLAGAAAGVVTGLVVGLGVSWPPSRRSWRLPAVVTASTGVTFALSGGAVGLASDLPWPAVFVFAAVASLWGPVVSDFWRRREAQVIGLCGAGVALLVLSAVLPVAAQDRAGAESWIARLWLSGLGGAGSAEALWRLRLLDRRDSALLGLAALVLTAACLAGWFELPTLPIGLGAGLVFAGRQGPEGQLGRLLAPARPLAVLLFAAVLIASTDAVSWLWPPVPGLYEIVLAQLGVLAAVRGLGPALWYPLPEGREFSRHAGWLLVPKGLIAAELVLGVGAGLPRLLAPAHADLLRRVVAADLLLYGAVWVAVVARLQARSDATAAGAAGTPPAVA